jgi:hypothetical protein
LQVQTERVVPSPIFVAALLTVTRLRIVRLPDLALTANEEARDRIVKPIIINHWRENGGRVPAFGGITGYVLVSVAGYGGLDFGWPFSMTGDRIGARTSRRIQPAKNSRYRVAGTSFLEAR